MPSNAPTANIRGPLDEEISYQIVGERDRDVIPTWQLMTEPYFWNSWNRSSSLTCAGRLRTKTLEVSLNEAFVLLLPRVKPLSADESMMAAALHTRAQ